MSEDELKAIEARAADAQLMPGAWNGYANTDRKALLVEVRRLRGLIEWTAPKAYQTDHGDRVRSLHEPCPWCNRYPCETAPGGHKDCPAFTESGDVR